MMARIITYLLVETWIFKLFFKNHLCVRKPTTNLAGISLPEDKQIEEIMFSFHTFFKKLSHWDGNLLLLLLKCELAKSQI